MMRIDCARLSELLGIFRDQMPDFSKNRADGDDIIGDAYEYLMRNFATESGKSKGQFYTPAEVSRILAKVVGIERATGNDITLYDPACGSGSLLIRAAEVAPVEVAIYGQEKEGTTAGLARMNLAVCRIQSIVHRMNERRREDRWEQRSPCLSFMPDLDSLSLWVSSYGAFSGSRPCKPTPIRGAPDANHETGIVREEDSLL